MIILKQRGDKMNREFSVVIEKDEDGYFVASGGDVETFILK